MKKALNVAELFLMCAGDGGWCDWAPESKCSVTCGDGEQRLKRKCKCPVPAGGGDPCSGEDVKTVTCNLKECSRKCSHWMSLLVKNFQIP